MKAALYTRVPTDEQRKESIDDQLRECRELCQRHGFDSIDEFSDKARSGNEVNRPGYQKILRSARNRKYDVIVAHELSRLWRSESEMHAVTSPALAERLAHAESQLAAEDGRDERTPAQRRPPSKDFYKRFLATISEKFAENARETRATLLDQAYF